jgi:hypothetical protein
MYYYRYLNFLQQRNRLYIPLIIILYNMLGQEKLQHFANSICLTQH